MEKEKQNKYINIAKALGIICVVIGHSISPINRLIYLFHMPLFFFISGYLYNDKYSSNPILLIQKRLKTLWIPYVSYQLLFALLHNLFFQLHIYDETINNINPYSSRVLFVKANFILRFSGSELMGAAMWFIPALFTTSILFCIIQYTIKSCHMKSEIKKQIILLSVIILAFLFGIIRTKAQVSQICFENTALVALSIYYAGWIFKKYEGKIKFKFSYALISLVGLMLLWKKFNVRVEMNKNNYSNAFLFIVGWVLGIYLILYISKILSYMQCRLLNYIGTNTMTIMCLHFVALKIVSYLQIVIYRLPIEDLAKFPVLNSKNGWWVAYTIVGVAVPILIKYIISNIISLIKSMHK